MWTKRVQGNSRVEKFNGSWEFQQGHSEGRADEIVLVLAKPHRFSVGDAASFVLVLATRLHLFSASAQGGDPKEGWNEDGNQENEQGGSQGQEIEQCEAAE
jgi:hypothetical protein